MFLMSVDKASRDSCGCYKKKKKKKTVRETCNGLSSFTLKHDWIGLEAYLWAWKDDHHTAFIVSYSELINGILGHMLLHLI